MSVAAAADTVDGGTEEQGEETRPHDALPSKLTLQSLRDGHPNSLTGRMAELLLKQGIGNGDRLDWQSGFMGWTGCIDSIQAKHVSKPVMWGIDEWARLFVTIRTRLVVMQGEDEECGGNKSKKCGDIEKSESASAAAAGFAPNLGVETFFQRYNSDEHTWWSGSHGNHLEPMCGIAPLHHMGEVEFNHLSHLLTNGLSIFHRMPSVGGKTRKYRLTLA